MSAVDDPDAAWYHPCFWGPGGMIGEDAAAARAGWVSATPAAGTMRPGHSAFRVASRLAGAVQLHYVNAIDPGTAGDWLLPGVLLDTFTPARTAGY